MCIRDRFISLDNSLIIRSLVFLSQPPIIILLAFFRKLKLLELNKLFISSSRISLGATPNLLAFSEINSFEPILLSIQNNFKLGLNFSASKPMEPQPAPISKIVPFSGNSKSAKI